MHSSVSYPNPASGELAATTTATLPFFIRTRTQPKTNENKNSSVYQASTVLERAMWHSLAHGTLEVLWCSVPREDSKYLTYQKTNQGLILSWCLSKIRMRSFNTGDNIIKFPRKIWVEKIHNNLSLISGIYISSAQKSQGVLVLVCVCVLVPFWELHARVQPMWIIFTLLTSSALPSHSSSFPSSLIPPFIFHVFSLHLTFI